MTSLLICFAPLALAIRTIKMNDNLYCFQPSSEAFKKGIEQYIEGLEPSLCDGDHSSECETSGDSSSESDSEVLNCCTAVLYLKVF